MRDSINFSCDIYTQDSMRHDEHSTSLNWLRRETTRVITNEMNDKKVIGDR